MLLPIFRLMLTFNDPNENNYLNVPKTKFGELDNSQLAVVEERKTCFQSYHVATEHEHDEREKNNRKGKISLTKWGCVSWKYCQ